MEADEKMKGRVYMDDVMEDISVLKTVSVLYVEDEYLVRESIARFLKRRCKAVYEAENGKAGLELYNRHDVDIVITDLEMPVMNGFEMVKRILKTDGTPPIIITTGYNDDEHLVKEACERMIKPIDEDKLIRAILFCLGKNCNECTM
ncbi:MAG: response regulator [Nitrospirae bacterium]|nr:response regulator [Nitrospirota bacterium]